MSLLLASCGGGDSVSNTTDGILSIEQITSPAVVGGQGTVRVKLIAPSGGPGSGAVSISSGSSTLVAFSPSSQSVNSSGEALFYFTASETETDTQVPVTVSAGSLSLTKQVSVIGTGTIGLTVTAPPATDAVGSITATFAGGAKGAGRTVTISSDKSSNVAFDFTTQTADNNGQAIFTYRVINITADTNITFTAKSGTQTVTKSILINAASITAPGNQNRTVTSIGFVSASPTIIALKGTGGSGRTETSIVTFVVRDDLGTPMANQPVALTLSTLVGGLTVTPASALSDQNGLVKAYVSAGIVATPIRVMAEISTNKSISVVSDTLVVTTGLPHQDGLSVSISNLHPEALEYDGTEVTVTAMLADHFGNPVPDGTAVKFICYGGSIEPAGFTTSGIASVKWRSQNPRPADGVARILVYAIGEESFIDYNGNGVADPAEFNDLPEAFLSMNGSPVRTPADPFIDYNGDGLYNSGDGLFNGVLQGTLSARPNVPRSLHIFSNVGITMSGSQVAVTALTPAIAQNASTPVKLTITDQGSKNSLPEGTTIQLSSTVGGCYPTAGLKPSPASFTINRSGQTSFDVTLSNTCTTNGSGNLIVTATTPNSVISSKTITITY